MHIHVNVYRWVDNSGLKGFKITFKKLHTAIGQTFATSKWTNMLFPQLQFGGWR